MGSLIQPKEIGQKMLWVAMDNSSGFLQPPTDFYEDLSHWVET